MTPLPGGAIRVTNAAKCYTKYEDTPTLAYGLLHALKKGRRSKLWAVKGVDLEITPGESVGVIGKNGSGKSTLLQMLCGVTGPTTGEVRVGGRIAPLISVGVGFHPELTGRENIYVNGTILGLTRREVARRLDEIVAFSEIEAFIDTPVKFYSSGMFVRLGFSVAAHVDPDVLLIDEVLAVGDLGFQVKCYDHMSRLRSAGTTIVLVSHSMPAIERNCDRGIVLVAGQIEFDGDVSGAIEALVASVSKETAGSDASPSLGFDNGVVEVLSARLVNQSGEVATRFRSGDTARILVEVEALADINAPYMAIGVLSMDGVVIYREHNLFRPFGSVAAGERATFQAWCRLSLATGSYKIAYTLGRGNPASRDPSRVASDAALIVPPHRLEVYVSGREEVEGLADLGATFHGPTPPAGSTQAAN